jgi:hypothetical protein
MNACSFSLSDCPRLVSLPLVALPAVARSRPDDGVTMTAIESKFGKKSINGQRLGTSGNQAGRNDSDHFSHRAVRFTFTAPVRALFNFG